MFSYIYTNDYIEYEAIFYEPFKRFHHCMAATIHEEKDGVRYDYLISYATPIAFVIQRNGLSYVYINEDSYNCSMSTIHQLSRWLREIDCGCTYQDIKDSMTNTSFSVWCNDMKTKIVKCDRDSLEQHVLYDIKNADQFTYYAIH